MTSTAKNYAGQNLQGRSFKGQDLSGADFSGADLRGVDFADAILRGANFYKSEMGVQKHSLVVVLIITFLLLTFSGFLNGFAGFWLSSFVTPENIKTYTIIPIISSISLLVVIFLAIIFLGFTALAFGILVLSLVVILAITLTFASAEILAGVGAGIMTSAVALAGAGVGAGAISSAASNTVAEIGFITSSAASLVISITSAVFLVLCIPRTVSINIHLSVAVALATTLFSFYIGWRSVKNDPKFSILLDFAIILGVTGGTCFRGADLTETNFNDAKLKSSDFRNSRKQSTNFTRTIWKQAKKLDRSRLGTSILSNPDVRELLVTGKPNPSKSYEGLNLRGANLDGVYLENVNFKRATLSEASFRNANLEWVNLTETQAIGTDFTGAQMTGVCLEGWSYDHTTKLDDVDCRFVFELEHPNAKGSRERRPHDENKDFEKGDFTKLYSETLNVVKLLIRNGINPEAFNDGWQKAIKNNPKISFENIQEIKKKGQDVEVIVVVPEGTDKSKFEQNFDSGYETKLKEIEAKYQAVLEGKDAEITTLLTDKKYFQDLFVLQLTQPINIHNEFKPVVEQNPVTFTARDITNSVVNLGKIKGNVTNAINQIPNKEDSGDIKTLLTQLQEAISSDHDLTDEDKADALEQVGELAKIAIHDKPSEKSNLASKAIRALKRIVNNISVTQIIETMSKFFGLA